MNINIPSAIKCQRGNLTQNNTFELADFKIDPSSKLIDVMTDVKIHSATVENKRLVMHGECVHHILCHCDGEYSIRDINTPIRYESDVRFNETDDSSIHCFTHPTCTSTRGRCDSERLYIDSELSFSMLAYKKERIELIDSLTIKEPLEKYTRGMTIFYPDKKTTLWDVAKRYGESIEALKKKNSLPDTSDISKKKYLVI